MPTSRIVNMNKCQWTTSLDIIEFGNLGFPVRWQLGWFQVTKDGYIERETIYITH